MAKSKFNWLTQGMSGLLGDLMVFRQRANKTIVAKRPKPSEKEPTAGQMECRKKFRKAVAYAKSAVGDTVMKAAYQLVAKPGQTAFNRAVKDYQIAPELDDAIITGYSGGSGEFIRVSAIDDFKVRSVYVLIKTMAEAIVEEGEAVQEPDGLEWVYTSTAVNSELPGTKVVFTAVDIPGNKTVLEVMA